MSSLRNSYERITFNNGTKTIQEKAVKYGAIRRMLNSWTIPSNSSVYISATTPDISSARVALLGRAIHTLTSTGIKYKVWTGASSIVYQDPSSPVFVSPGTLTLWRKVASVSLVGAVLVDEFWVPDSSQAGGGSGSFEEAEEVRLQPASSEVVIQIQNLDNSQSHDVLLQLIYLEDTKGLILYPGGM